MRSLLAFALCLLSGCASTDQTVNNEPDAAAAARPLRRAFDVPALLGLDADQVVQALASRAGRATPDRTPRTLPSGEVEARHTFWRDTTALVVSYDPTTRRVTSFFVRTEHGLNPDYAPLLTLASVSRHDQRLRLEPVFSVVNPQLYTGVRIVPRR